MLQTSRRILVCLAGVGILAAAAAAAASSPAPGAPAPAPALTLAEARALTDTLLQRVSAVRELKVLRPVPVAVASRAELRARLEEIAAQDHVEERLRQDEKLLEFLGLLPAGQDLMKLYKDLLEEQVAGFYDIDKRNLVFADWVPPSLQTIVADHELTHALQDQHFSLRVRKKLGFETPDAEAAWDALVEGDASAVMAQMMLDPRGKESFTALADSAVTALDRAPLASVAAGLQSERFLAAPGAVRSMLTFPYLYGLRFVGALYKAGGWQAVDDAYVHPPVSTEQIMHPDLFLSHKDSPVSIDIPIVGGVLGSSYRPVASGVLGEYDLYAYLRQYVDAQVADVACSGWAGGSYALYGDERGTPQSLVMVTMWDSEDDAVEFFGAAIGALEARYPKQVGYAEASSQDQVLWKLDAEGRRLNVLRVSSRQVVVLERVPANNLMRILQKLDIGLQVEDPTPEMRALRKEDLPSSVQPEPAAGDSSFTLRLALPAGWEQTEEPADPRLVLAARRGAARLVARVDRTVAHGLGVGGYAHSLAEELQKGGQNVYVQIDIDFPRKDLKMYQHVFSQKEAGNDVVHCLGVVELSRGYGYVLVSGPSGGDDDFIQDDFFKILEGLAVVPAGPADSQAAPPPPHGN